MVQVGQEEAALRMVLTYRTDRTLRWTKIFLSGVVTGIAIAYVSS